MKQIITFLVLGVLVASVSFAQQTGSSVPSVMQDLDAALGVEENVAEVSPAPVLDNVTTEDVSSARVLAGTPRRAEERAMADVDLEWGLILRYYPVTDRFVESMLLDGVDQVMDITEKFSVVDFPENSLALYMPELQKLFVRNTADNLLQIEEILTAFEQAEKQASAEQVEIEARFVEFSEGALEELGFDWSTPGSVDLPGEWSLPSIEGDGQNLFSDSLRSVPFTQTGDLGLGETSAAAGAWSVNRLEDMFNDSATGAGTLGFTGEISGDTVDLLIRALDQTSGADLLSAPSVVTLSGESATIVVGELHSYPEVYETGSSAGTMVHVKYEDFGEKILGVEMDVTPTIVDDEIKMKINPRVTELLGWEQFQIAPADTSYNFYQQRIGQQFEHDAVVARLPVFKRREIKTEISIANGSTVGMGGLVSEKTEAFSDRVPVLGSIPLFGRLFRSEGERTVKRSLMIFVTASKVNPSGRKVSTRTFK